MKLTKTRKSLKFVQLIQINDLKIFHVVPHYKHNDIHIKVSKVSNFNQ
jgi:hypothetical protein